MRARLAYAAHRIVNRLAWRYGLKPGWKAGQWRVAVDGINREHWTWRLNDRLARVWVDPYLRPELTRRVAAALEEGNRDE